jgi:hypothetical protein
MQTRLVDGFFRSVILLAALALLEIGARGQVSVVTAHNDPGRTGQYLNETTLTPSNVNVSQFGKLFSHSVNGATFTQPLYVAKVPLASPSGTTLGTHNIVIVATAGNYLYSNPEAYLGDAVYAFDADTNGGQNSGALWYTSLLSAPVPTPGAYPYLFGVVGTPVINAATNTMYLVDAGMMTNPQTSTPTYVNRLHAINITNGLEEAGSPVVIQASVPGTGAASVNGVVSFDPIYHVQHPALLLQNNVVYIAYGSVNDEGPWHGWLFSYSATTLQQIDVFCTSPNGSGAGIWMSGAGLVGEINNPATKPYGRIFFSTGNGSFAINAPTVASQPYSNPANSYGMSVVDVDVTGGNFTVEDVFSPYNEATLSTNDADLGSGGPILLPSQTLSSGKVLNPLIQIGKTGLIYILDRDNTVDGSNNPSTEYSPAGLGGFNAGGDQVFQEVKPSMVAGDAYGWGAGVWGTEAYWNGTIYSGGTNPAVPTPLSAYSIVSGVVSSTPTGQSTQKYSFPGPTPTISANGNTNGILWAQAPGVAGILQAYDATNLGNLLYSNSQNLARDSAGSGDEFVVPTIANGKVYVAALGEVSVFGLLAEPTTPTPVISPGSTVFSGSVTVSIADPGATIYFTTDGTTPSPGVGTTQVYSNAITVNTNETITAIGSIAGELQSALTSATYTSSTSSAAPTFSLAGGTYTGTQTLTIAAATGATIYYAVDGSMPTTASLVYSGPLTISATQIVQAVAVLPGLTPSSVTSATYIIQAPGSFNFSGGFAQADGPIQFNGSTDLDDFRLQLTNGGLNEAGSAFYAAPVNIQQFTTTFTFQLSNPAADGITFTIQNNAATALGGYGGELGYGGIQKSLAIKFDLYSNAGEGPDSTGLFLNGVIPTEPNSIDLSQAGINLHDGDYFYATLTYDGANLTLTLSDAISQASWTHVFSQINIPQIVGGNTAYVGFTGGTGGQSSSQKLTSWTYVPGPPLPSYSAGFAPGSMTLNGGAALTGTLLELTDGGPVEARSAFFSTPVSIQQFTTNFQFQLTNANADGFAFMIQRVGPTAVGGNGAYLGGGMGDSIAVKFDLYSNAGEGPDSTGLYLNGAVPTTPAIDLSTSGINLHSGDIFNVQLSYDGITLTEVITDTVTNASVTETYMVDIPAAVGSTTAWVGFTGGTGVQSAVQQILNWSYSPLNPGQPEFFTGFSTAASQLTLNGGATINGNRLRLTDGNPLEARSAFFNSPVDIQKFATNFNFQLTNAAADGFTFTFQGVGPTALGAYGGWLGAGFGQSVVLKFDLFSNAGEGADSTGLYTSDVIPTVPAVDLSSTGINLHSGDTFNVTLTYNGTTLTVVITDLVTHAAATQTYAVNIPAIVGGSTAYVGFTGGTGGQAAIQEILNWNYAAAGTN